MSDRALVERFLAAPDLAEATRRAYRVDVEEFAGWLHKGGASLADVDAATLSAYAAELGAARPGRRPRKLARATIARKLAAVRALLRYALGPGRVSDAQLGPRRARRLPETLKAEEIEAVLEGLVGDGPLALRNRALLELVYSAGLRSREAVDGTTTDGGIAYVSLSDTNITGSCPTGMCQARLAGFDQTFALSTGPLCDEDAQGNVNEDPGCDDHDE